MICHRTLQIIAAVADSTPIPKHFFVAWSVCHICYLCLHCSKDLAAIWQVQLQDPGKKRFWQLAALSSVLRE